MTKLYTEAGVSAEADGEYTFRATTRGLKYKDILEDEGKVDVKLVSLPNPMTKDEAKVYIRSLPGFQSEEIQKCLTAGAKVVVIYKAPVAKAALVDMTDSSDVMAAIMGGSMLKVDTKVNKNAKRNEARRLARAAKKAA